MTQSELTRALLHRVQTVLAKNREPLIVFDLDGTLYNNAPRTLRILLEYSHLHANRYPELYGLIDTLPAAGLEYRVTDTLRRLGVDDETLLGDVQQFWQERFFTNSYEMHDLPTPGSVEFVDLFYKAGAIPVYLTGRDAPNMLQGTVESFQRDGFPVGTYDTRLILKDRFDRDDMQFKISVFDHLRRAGDVIAVFDNEPGLSNLFKEQFGDATVFWLNTRYAPTEDVLRDDVVVIKDFTPLLVGR